MMFFREQKSEDDDTESAKDEVTINLTRRVMDVMLMKKTQMEKNVEHYKNNGVKLTGKWLDLHVFSVNV